jgi:hypothetical protein
LTIAALVIAVGPVSERICPILIGGLAAGAGAGAGFGVGAGAGAVQPVRINPIIKITASGIKKNLFIFIYTPF